MPYLAINKNGVEKIFAFPPIRKEYYWYSYLYPHDKVTLPKGSIKKFIGKDLTWEDEPVELK